MCCSESEDSIDIELNSENSLQLRLCFLFSSSRVSHRDPMYCTLSFNCVQVQTLPTAQATLALTDSFSRRCDPDTHACKARPPTTVGWTSLSVIVIVIVLLSTRFVSLTLARATSVREKSSVVNGIEGGFRCVCVCEFLKKRDTSTE